MWPPGDWARRVVAYAAPTEKDCADHLVRLRRLYSSSSYQDGAEEFRKRFKGWFAEVRKQDDETEPLSEMKPTFEDVEAMDAVEAAIANAHKARAGQEG